MTLQTPKSQHTPKPKTMLSTFVTQVALVQTPQPLGQQIR